MLLLLSHPLFQCASKPGRDNTQDGVLIHGRLFSRPLQRSLFALTQRCARTCCLVDAALVSVCMARLGVICIYV